MELKTLKELDINYLRSRGEFENLIKAEAINHIKFLNDDVRAKANLGMGWRNQSFAIKFWIKHFFNITESDLKESK